MSTENTSIWRQTTETNRPGQLDITVILMSLIACLANLALILVSPTLPAAIAATGQV